MKGRCNCGNVSFRVVGNFPAMYQCHCSLCQKQGGSGSNAATIVRVENFEWITTSDSITSWKKDSGFNSHFCKVCGSPVPNPIGDTYVWIPVGLMGNVKSKVVAHLWLSSKSEWDNPISAIRDYDVMPEDLDEFVRFLHSESNT